MVNLSSEEMPADQIWRLYVPGDTQFYSQNRDGTWSYQKKPLSFSNLMAHIVGDITVGVPCTWNGRGKFLSIDVDTDEADNLRRLAACLQELGVPHLLSFSGSKGYHADIFVKESEASRVAQAAGLLKTLLSERSVVLDEVYPTGTGLTGKTPGGANIKLPLGYHKETEHLCYCLDEKLNPVDDPLPLLRSLGPIDVRELLKSLAERLHLAKQIEEVEEPWESAHPFKLHHSKPCLNILWQEGLQRPGTRHSATMAIGLALPLNKEIPDEYEEALLIEWVQRIHEPGMEKGYIHRLTTLEHATEEARRLYQDEIARAYFGVTCVNRLLRPAMKSACRDPVGCHVGRNRGRIDFTLLSRLGLFNPRNSKEPGIGRCAGFVYQAHQQIAQEHAGKLFQYEGKDAYAAPLAMLRELSGCSRKTVSKANKALREIGLLMKVPKKDVPKHFQRKALAGEKPALQAAFYCLPDLTEEYVRDVVLPKGREYGR